MAADRVAGRDENLGTRILPFRGEAGRVPSSVLVRQALSAADPPVGVLRSGMAVAAALGTDVIGTAENQDPAGLGDLAARTGLSAGEVKAGLEALRSAAVLTTRGGELRLDPNLYCSLPALAELDWEGCRKAIEVVKGRPAPALALLRELARLSGMAADGGGSWVHPSIGDLVEETLYGRTAMTQALGDATRAGLLKRVEQPPRRGLRIRLEPRAFGHGSGFRGTELPGASVPSHGSPAGSGASLTGVTVRLGGAEIGVPAGSRLQLPQGRDYRLEIGPEGGAIICIDD